MIEGYLTVSKEEANNSVLTSSDVVEENNGMTPKEAKAIKLAQNKWVEQYKTIEGVTFNVSIQSDGKYLVIVYDTKTTHLIKGYIVDVTTEIVNEK